MNTALRFAALSTLAISSFGATFTPQPAQAALFGERAVEQNSDALPHLAERQVGVKEPPS